MLLTIAIPAYDEVANLGPAVDEARAAAALVAPGEAEILVVDDGSRDGTAAVADDLAARSADVRDGQTPMAELVGFFERIGDSDIVVGVRASARSELKRRGLSRGFHLLSRGLFSLPEREFSSAFLFRRSLLAAMRFRSKPRSAALLPEILFRARRRGARISVREIEQRARWSGRAKGGQLSVALLTLAELFRVAFLARIDERWRALGAGRKSSAEALR